SSSPRTPSSASTPPSVFSSRTKTSRRPKRWTYFALSLDRPGCFAGPALFREGSAGMRENSRLFLDKAKPCAILAKELWKEGRVKYPVVSSLRHKGKTIELDATREILTLIGINGEAMGNLSWDFVIDQILAYRKPPVSREARTEP